MKKKQLISFLQKAYDNVQKEVASHSNTFYGAGLASEGFAGGYQAALQDCILLLNNVAPNTRTYWDFLEIQ